MYSKLYSDHLLLAHLLTWFWNLQNNLSDAHDVNTKWKYNLLLSWWLLRGKMSFRTSVNFIVPVMYGCLFSFLGFFIEILHKNHWMDFSETWYEEGERAKEKHPCGSG